MEKDSRIYVAGGSGMVGSMILRRLREEGYTNIITRTHEELDLRHQGRVENFFRIEKPEYVVLAAAAVGGIRANSDYPATFIYDNLAIQTNVIHSAHVHDAKKLLFFGSSCAYPKECPQPMKEEYILSGYPEPTNKPYAVAKIAGIIMCQAYSRQYGRNFISVIPSNLYGPDDNFDPDTSHVIPSLIRRFHEAKAKRQPAVLVWGTGNQRREFLHIKDLVSACLLLMEGYDSPEPINIGSGADYSIKELAYMLKDIVGYGGEVVFDASKPDGFPQKLLCPSKLNSLGWQAGIPLKEGLRQTYKWYLEYFGYEKGAE